MTVQSDAVGLSYAEQDHLTAILGSSVDIGGRAIRLNDVQAKAAVARLNEWMQANGYRLRKVGGEVSDGE